MDDWEDIRREALAKREYDRRRKNNTYQQSKERINELRRNRYRANKERAIEYFGGRCMRCAGVFPPIVFDFHHRDPKEKDGQLIAFLGKSNWDEILAELDKCDMLCANCHRIAHVESDEG